MDKKVRLSVVIPAYKEIENLRSGVLDEVDEYLKKQKYDWEVLIIDDGSPDNTVLVAKEIIKNKTGFRVIKNPHGGKALTVISGMQMTKGEVSVFTDMDQATPIYEIEKLFPKFDAGFDVVIGSRSGRPGAPLVRKLAAFGFALLRGVILGLPFKDTQCGFKAFNQKAIQTVFPELEKIWKNKSANGAAVNAGFDVEMLYLLKKKGFRIEEVPVNWRHVGTERVQIIKDSIEALTDMIRIRLNSLSGKYS